MKEYAPIMESCVIFAERVYDIMLDSLAAAIFQAMHFMGLPSDTSPLVVLNSRLDAAQCNITCGRDLARLISKADSKN